MGHEVRTSVKLSVKTPKQTNVTSIWSDRIFVAHVFWPSYKTTDYLRVVMMVRGKSDTQSEGVVELSCYNYISP